MTEVAASVCQYEKAHREGWFGETLHPGGRSLTRHALELAGLPVNARVLDLGCGCGNAVADLRMLGYRAIGVDRSLMLLEEADSEKSLLACANGLELPFASASFQAVLAECSLSLLRPTASALANIANLLVGGGTLIVSDLYARQPRQLTVLRSCLPESCVSHAFDADEFLSVLHENHFEFIHWEDHAELVRNMLQPESLPLIFGTQIESGNTLDMVLQIAQVKLSYFLCIAKKNTRYL